MINSGSSRDLIKPSIARRLELSLVKYKLYILINYNGSKIGTVNSRTKTINLRIGRRHKKYIFNLVPREINNITLGI